MYLCKKRVSESLPFCVFNQWIKVVFVGWGKTLGQRIFNANYNLRALSFKALQRSLIPLQTLKFCFSLTFCNNQGSNTIADEVGDGAGFAHKFVDAQ